MLFGLFGDSSNKDNTFFTSIVIAFIFFFYVLPKLEKQHVKEEMDTLASISNAGDVSSIDSNTCSRDCCRHVQWQPPHMPPLDQPSEYISTNFSCNRGEGSGCLCVKQGEFDNLKNRGGNRKLQC